MLGGGGGGIPGDLVNCSICDKCTNPERGWRQLNSMTQAVEQRLAVAAYFVAGHIINIAPGTNNNGHILSLARSRAQCTVDGIKMTATSW